MVPISTILPASSHNDAAPFSRPDGARQSGWCGLAQSVHGGLHRSSLSRPKALALRPTAAPARSRKWRGRWHSCLLPPDSITPRSPIAIVSRRVARLIKPCAAAASDGGGDCRVCGVGAPKRCFRGRGRKRITESCGTKGKPTAGNARDTSAQGQHHSRVIPPEAGHRTAGSKLDDVFASARPGDKSDRFHRGDRQIIPSSA